jgi:hypothetical protein
MNITIKTGELPRGDYTNPSDFFELDENGFPLHEWQIAEKVKKHNSPEVIYTQSEIVINGFRIKRRNGEIEELTILHFWNGEIHGIKVNKDGSIHNWSEGFFDQTDKDFKILFGF